MSGSIVVTQGTMPATRQWRGAAWNGTAFLVVASGPTDRAATSPDGVVWTERTLPSSRHWRDVASSAGVFCAVADGATTVATSPDGASWTQGAAPVSMLTPNIVGNGAIFCVVDSNNIMTSADGLSWIVVASPPVANVIWADLMWSGGKFYAIGSVAGDNTNTHVISSPDGVSWTDHVITGTFGSGVASKGTTVIATSSTADVNISQGGGSFFITPLPTAGAASKLAGDGSGFFGINPGSSNAVISPDGVTWETHSLGVSRTWLTPAFGNGVFVSVGFSSAGSIAVAVTYPEPEAFWTHYVKTTEVV